MQNLTGMNGGKCFHGELLLVIIYNLYIVRIAIYPSKTDTILSIDSNAVLSCTITGWLFESIRRIDH
jgi:hypothetical protein